MGWEYFAALELKSLADFWASLIFSHRNCENGGDRKNRLYHQRHPASHVHFAKLAAPSNGAADSTL